MKVPVQVERQSGLFSTLGYPESILHLRRFIDDADLAATPAGRELAPLVAPGAGTHMSFSFRRLAESLKDFFSRYDVRVVGEQTAPITVAVNELHCPRVKGTRAKLSVEVEVEEASSCSVEILGIGGGDEHTLKFVARDTLEIEANCVGAVYSFPAVWESCEILTGDGTKVHRWARLKEVLLEDGEKVEGAPLDPDACQLTSPASPSVAGWEPGFDLTKGEGISFSRQLTLEAGATTKQEVGLKLDKLGLEAKADVTITRKYKTEFEYTLAPGHHYLPFRPPESARWLWKVLK